MKEFDSLGAFAMHLLEREVATVVALQACTDEIGHVVQEEAISEFGVYQSAAGPFPAWEELAEATKEDRLAQGYSENEPLLRSGELRDSTSHTSEPLEAVIGSTDPVMVFHELGTSKMPPRPVFGPAVVHSEAKIAAIVGGALVVGLVGESEIWRMGIGYKP